MAANEWRKIKRYAGQWVALWKNKVVAHGRDGKKVYQQALHVGKMPRIFQVPDEADEVYLLWS